MMLKTTKTLETVPIATEYIGDGDKGSAVITTKPAKAPLSTMVKSALPQVVLHTKSAECASSGRRWC